MDTRLAPAPARAAWIIFAAGVCAALHVGKLPPAIGALQQALGMTLLEAGFMLALVQAAGMAAGIAFGVLADAIGLRRSMVCGLVLLAGASAAGAASSGVPMLLALRAVEGFGFLLIVLPAPGLIRRLVDPKRLSVMLGLWGTYMPLGAALGLLAGPQWIAALGWRSWWIALALLPAAMAVLLRLGAADDGPLRTPAAGSSGVQKRLKLTLGSRGPWLVAICFALYSGQWLAVIGFLPIIFTSAGVGAGATGVLTALAALVNVAGKLQPQIRHRGMFEAVVYTSEVKLSGRFRWQEREGEGIGAITRLRFSGARLMLAAGDLRALRITSATIDGVPLTFEPATRGPEMAVAERRRKAAIDAAIAGLDAARLADGVRFEISFTINGSERIAFEPAGNLTEVKVGAPWADPGFFGPFRPVEQRIGADRFDARWQVSILGRGFGNAGTSADGSSATLIKRLADSAFGVNLVQPVTPYRGVDRMLKYGLLTVGCVFALYLAFEIAGRARLHPVQYALSGAAMALFPLLLLSAGEHLGFVAAYTLAAASVVAQTAWYTWHATRQRRFTILFATASAALFGYLYMLLQAENWSLLGGSLALFAALTGLMYATRNIGRAGPT